MCIVLNHVGFGYDFHTHTLDNNFIRFVGALKHIFRHFLHVSKLSGCKVMIKMKNGAILDAILYFGESSRGILVDFSYVILHLFLDLS